MAKSDWEAKLRSWAEPPAKTEEQRCENAVKMIRDAIGASAKLSTRNVSVILQGSYRNNTNVRGESDVDVGVVCTTTMFYNLPPGMTKEDFSLRESNYRYAQFKSEVEEALRAHFRAGTVTRGNKAIDVRETSHHVEADVAPFFEHRWYFANRGWHTGVELRPDNDAPPRVINWPEQHYANGTEKNNATGRRFKAIVRVVKTLRNEMLEDKVVAAEPAVGFLLECLVWNLPNGTFGNADYYDDLKAALAAIYNATKDGGPCDNWTEVSKLKGLFSPEQKWTHQQANSFALAAWNYIGFQ